MNSKTEKITPEFLFLNRRNFMKNHLLAATLASLPYPLWANTSLLGSQLNDKYKNLRAGDTLTKEEVAISYNNFYEFSLEKDEVKKKVEKWTLDKNWKIEISGLVEKPKTYSLEDLVALVGGSVEERIYKFRCVEAWSMVIPWTGFSLALLIEKLKPKSKAQFVQFQTFSDKKIAPNFSELSQYPWPYTEGLTIEEAMNPLTLIATGMYGKPLPKQNGAPLRLVVPWKYGFKSIKSIVKIEFTDKQPKTLWNQLAPKEYGFYANVNPQVDHPRWSQSSERILDTSFLPKRKPTLLFNGYEKEVASLYKGLDLTKNF
jgi:sulfoxide reductase catalytic subunit YedY